MAFVDDPAFHCSTDLLLLHRVTFVLASATMASSSSNVVGVHYRVGKKIGEGSFGVIFEGTNLLNNQQVAIKFVRQVLLGRQISDRDRPMRLRMVD